MIHAEHLVKRYGDAVALDDLSFTLTEGGVHGILGARGAGKSTLLAVLSGTVQPDGGSLTVGGSPDLTPLQLRTRMGYLPERSALYEDMTPFEYKD